MSSFFRLLRRPLLPGILLTLLSAALILPGLGAGIVTRESELRVLICARNMAEGGSWLIPNYFGEERLRKPPLMYWITATAFELAGSTESEAAARAGAAAAGIALVLATFYCGRRLVGRRAAFLAAIVLATSIGFVRHSRLAETDMAQSLFTSLAIFAAYAAVISDRPLRWWLACGTAAGTGFMFKGPASLAMPLAAVVTFLLCERFSKPGRRRAEAAASGMPGCKTHVDWRGVVAALALFTAIVVPWYVAVALNTSNATRDQAGDELSRLLVESHHPGPFVYYIYTLPSRLGIWALLIPVAVFGAWKRIRHHRGALLVLCWFASTFVILSALQSKQQHYAILLFTPSALLCGWLLKHGLKLPVLGKKTAGEFQSLEPTKLRNDFYARYAIGYVRSLCVLLVAAGAVVVLSHLAPIPAGVVPMRDAATTAAAICSAIGLAGLFWRRQPMLGGLAAICAAFALLMTVQVLRLEKFQTGFSIAPGFLDEHRGVLQKATNVLIAGPRTSVLAWYAGRDITIFDHNNTAAVWKAAKPGDVLIASDRAERERIAPQLSDVPHARVQHLDTVLSLYVKPETKP